VNGKIFDVVLDKTIFPGSFIGHELELKILKTSDQSAQIIKSGFESKLNNLFKILARPSPHSKSTITFFILENNRKMINLLVKNGVIKKSF